jgi:hypothetical protein
MPSSQAKTAPPICPRCHQPTMAEILTIAPVVHEPGLIAFECSRCGYLTSMLQPSPDSGNRGVVTAPRRRFLFKGRRGNPCSSRSTRRSIEISRSLRRRIGTLLLRRRKVARVPERRETEAVFLGSFWNGVSSFRFNSRYAT